MNYQNGIKENSYKPHGTIGLNIINGCAKTGPRCDKVNKKNNQERRGLYDYLQNYMVFLRTHIRF